MRVDYQGRVLKPWQIEAMKAGPRLARKALQGIKPYNSREYVDGKLTAEYSAWKNMIARCTKPNTTGWKYYGGRGIKVCRRWLKSYRSFLDDVGRRPSPAHSIDRYPDPDGDYRPGNVRWANPVEQANNKSWRLQKAKVDANRSSKKPPNQK